MPVTTSADFVGRVADSVAEPLLPDGFDAVAPYVDTWVLPDSNARAAMRQASSMAELRAFYDAMLPLAGSALQYLAAQPLEGMPPAACRLHKLMLGLAEVSTAIEWYGSPTVPDSFAFSRFHMIRQTADEGMQQ